MEIQNKFNNIINIPDLGTFIKFANSSFGENFNCMKIGIVDEVYSDLTVSVKLVNKKTLKQNHDGTQAVRDYALVRAKVCFCCPFITWDIKKGDECVILFSDRELESWFTTGEISPLAYQRMHDITDAVAVFGLRSLPNVISVLNGLNLFHGGSNIQIEDSKITANSTNVAINGITNITGNTSVTGTLTVSTGATGSFSTISGKRVEVVNGIVTSIA